MKDKLYQVSREVESGLRAGESAMVLPRGEDIKVYPSSQLSDLGTMEEIASALGGRYVFCPTSKED